MDHETSDLGRRVDKVPTLNIQYKGYQKYQNKKNYQNIEQIEI